MHYFNVLVNGKYFDCLYFASRMSVDSVLKYVTNEMKLTGWVEVQAVTQVDEDQY